MAVRRRKRNNLEDLRQVRFGIRQCKLLWYAKERGQSTAELAIENDISESYCRRLIQRGQEWAEQDRLPRFTQFRPERTKLKSDPASCPNCGSPIPAGETEICLQCFDSGFRHLDALKPSASDPKPDLKPTTKPLLPEPGRSKRTKAKKGRA